MVSLWARIVAVFHFILLSPPREQWPDQHPLSVSTKASGPAQPSLLADERVPPKPFLPPSAPRGSDFRCEYPKLKDYKFCSTYGDRSCWLKHSDPAKQSYNITTDYEKVFPEGITRKYYIEINEKTISPDGVSRAAMLVNGTYPGPWIEACWGDWLEITVNNTLQTNGTTIHWHGIRQLHTTANDGVNAITQCPIAPNQTFTYKFRAMQYGTSWYHSHYSLQYGDGVLGPLTIHGPSSADFDEAQPPVLMSDWLHRPWYSAWWDSIKTGERPADPDNILVGGEGTWPASLPSKEFRLDFVRGRRYLLRLINTSVDTTFVFSIDNHKIQVVGADFVPIVPYMTDHVVVGIGQRYHIIVTANPMDGYDDASYWIRTIPAAGCSPKAMQSIDNRTGIIIYKKKDPVDYPRTFSIECRDEPYGKLVPVLNWTVGSPSNIAANSEFDIGFDNITAGSLWPASIQKPRWNMYSDTMWLNFSNITLSQNLNAKQNEFNSHSVVVKQDSAEDAWVYFLLSGTGIPRSGRQYFPIAHPIHLHGHDFAILQQSSQPYQIGGLNLNLKNPPRRDVALLPASGFLVLAFKADNPGIWLMHCIFLSYHL
ncbi:hypothetical protein G647_05054 [Cladophialophora carrionii CBS 160.54]|uniref:Laccase n=1 Tax=Cladophialophora carrionii CBS 160.54 TaxID=1279043 RepID=V9D8S4_9EURO|nr:uncharacterized protein G647_05054 [Cladophialophora carrionii CBS 160.54]ETI23255.1 hypothetical protein G647_05054 [Cladophialophora carrionii CBS 160.54]